MLRQHQTYFINVKTFVKKFGLTKMQNKAVIKLF